MFDYLPLGVKIYLYILAFVVGAFLGSALGTAILSIFEKHGVYSIFGMDFYGSQLLCMVKVVCFIAAFCYVMKVSPRLMAKNG